MIGERISDDDLRQLLKAAAEAEPVPVDGAERVLAARDRLTRPRRRPRVSWSGVRKWAPATLVAVGILAGGAVAVGTHHDTHESASSGTYSFGPNRSSGPTGRVGSGAAAAPAPGSPTAPSGTPGPAGAQPRIVQTGSISLLVDGRGGSAVVDQISGVARGLGGYVSDSSTQSGGPSDDASVTVRVPVGAFGQALAQVSGLGHVTRSTTSGQDVTGEYVDLGARIRALQETRDTYVRILTRAGSIGDTLAVQQQITSVQTQIEQLQGQQQVLGDRSDLATLTVSITEPNPPRTTEHTGHGFSGAWHRARHGFVGGLQWLIAGSGPVLLVALIGLVLVWPLRWLTRRLRREFL